MMNKYWLSIVNTVVDTGSHLNAEKKELTTYVEESEESNLRALCIEHVRRSRSNRTGCSKASFSELLLSTLSTSTRAVRRASGVLTSSWKGVSYA